MSLDPRLVFVCLHGSAKSLMAAEYARRFAAERGLPLEVTSAGTNPDPEGPPHVVARLEALLDACASTTQGVAGSADAPGGTAPPSRRSLLTTGLCLLGGFVLTTLIGDGVSRSLGAEAAALELPANAPVTRFDFEQGNMTGWKTIDGRWAIEEMAEAPSGKRVLVQRAVENAFNVIVAPGGSYTDVDVSVQFKPISGREDASGGIVFRFENGRYYVVRANALEGNFGLYYYDRSRHEIASARVQPPALGRWHTMRVVVVGNHMQASLNDRLLLDHHDTRFRAGQVGLWTKADSVTMFRELTIQDKE